MQDPVSQSEHHKNESSFWKDVCGELFGEAIFEFLPNLLLGVVRMIAHGFAKIFD